MELSKKDRIILFNQYEILKRLDTDNAEQYEIYQDILAQGFEYNYEEKYFTFTIKFFVFLCRKSI